MVPRDDSSPRGEKEKQAAKRLARKKGEKRPNRQPRTQLAGQQRSGREFPRKDVRWAKGAVVVVVVVGTDSRTQRTGVDWRRATGQAEAVQPHRAERWERNRAAKRRQKQRGAAALWLERGRAPFQPLVLATPPAATASHPTTARNNGAHHRGCTYSNPSSTSYRSRAPTASTTHDRQFSAFFSSASFPPPHVCVCVYVCLLHELAVTCRRELLFCRKSSLHPLFTPFPPLTAHTHARDTNATVFLSPSTR